MSKESLTVVVGLPGVGKTEISRRVAEATLAERLNTDVVRKELFPTPNYTREESALMYQTMVEKADELLAAGFSVLLDGTFNGQRERELIKQLATEREMVLKIIEVICSDEVVLRERLEKRKGTGNPSDADFETYQMIKARFMPIEEEYLQVDNKSQSIEELERVVAEIVAYIQNG